MPEKTAANGSTYTVDGKQFVWTTDEGAEVRIPLRIKLKVIRSMRGRDLNDLDTMFDILEAIVPDQADTLDEQDVLDFQAMFSTWNAEYKTMSGATLGESSSSSD